MISLFSRRGARTLWSFILILGISIGLLTQPAWASRVRQIGLSDMAERAGRIFLGRCVARSVNNDPALGIHVTTYTFMVTRPVKGVGHGQVSFRIPGTPEAPLLSGSPVFDKGDEALLFLYPESPSGFSNAIGFEQGRFRIGRDPSGKLEAVNGRGNEQLLADVPEGLLRAKGLSGRRKGPVDLDGLLAVVESLAGRPRP